MGDESSRMLFYVNGFVFVIEVGYLLEVAEIGAEKIAVCEEGLFRYKYGFRGKAVPVVDMSMRICGKSTPLTGSIELLVVEIESHPFALIVDRIVGVVKGGGAIYRFPEILRTEENGYIKEMYRLNEELYLVLRPSSMLNDEEAAEMRVS